MYFRVSRPACFLRYSLAPGTRPRCPNQHPHSFAQPRFLRKISPRISVWSGWAYMHVVSKIRILSLTPNFIFYHSNHWGVLLLAASWWWIFCGQACKLWCCLGLLWPHHLRLLGCNLMLCGSTLQDAIRKRRGYGRCIDHQMHLVIGGGWCIVAKCFSKCFSKSSACQCRCIWSQ